MIEISLINILDILSISTAFMLGLLFLTTKSKNNKANVFLGLFLWSMTSEILSNFLDRESLDFSIVNTVSLTLPLFFLYVIKTLNYKFKLIYSLFAIPLLLEVLGIDPSHFIQYGICLLLLFYILKILKNHHKRLGDFYSDIENKTLSWAKNITYVYIFFYFFWITEEFAQGQFENISEYFEILSTILTLIIIFLIGYDGFTQPEIFNNSITASNEKEVLKLEAEQGNDEKINQQNEKHSIKIFHQLTEKIKDEKMFLQKDITIKTLSQKLKINEKEFSKLIKTHTDKNFYHYINQFRIEEFKQLLKTKKANHLSLLGLSEEAGFSSKSAFYRVFKLSENITPKQYQDQLNKSQ